MALTPLPPRPIPGSETFEADAGALLDALPVFGDELNDLQEDVAEKQELAASDRTQTGLDRVATGEDRVQTGLDRVQTGLDRVLAAQQATAAAGSASTVLAVNTVAQTQAAAAASSAGQAAAARDAAIAASAVAASPTERLSAISSAIHSGTVTRAIIYDTSKDSDGGQWRKRCTDKSWYTEEVQAGKWLGRATNEAGARAISGAVANDYYQNNTNGVFYRLNASGQTEVFRGNTREFPAVAGIVAEAGRLVIYDMATLGCPMWGVWLVGSDFLINTLSGGSITGLAAINGQVFVSTSTRGVSSLDFALDSGLWGGSNASSRRLLVPLAAARTGSVADRTSRVATFALASSTGNAIAATVLPNAPVDPTTNLAIPTIAVATSSGMNVIRHDGAVLTANSAVNFRRVIFDANNGIWAARQDEQIVYHALVDVWANLVGTALTTTSIIFASHTTNPTVGAPTRGLFISGSAGVARSSGGVSFGTNLMLGVLRANPAGGVSRAMTALATTGYQTGWLVGDNRLAALSNSVAETITSSVAFTPNFLTRVGFDNVVTKVSDQEFTSAGGLTGNNVTMSFPTVVGKSYKLRSVLKSFSGGTLPNMFARSAANGTGLTLATATSSSTLGAIFEVTFVAITSESSALWVSATEGSSFGVEGVSTVLVEADRSARNNALTINGNITKTEVAAAAQLVAYSGWSGANYLQQPYSSALDFGTGEWTIGGWVNVPTELPDSAFAGLGPNLVTNGTFATGLDGWTGNAAATLTVNDEQLYVANNTDSEAVATFAAAVPVVGKTYRLKWTQYTSSGRLTIGGYLVSSGASGTYTRYFKATNTNALQVRTNATTSGITIRMDSISIVEVTPVAFILDRSGASGPGISMGMTPMREIVATAFDGTTARTMTTTQTYNTGLWTKFRADYRQGRLSISVNGQEAAVTNGAPLLTMNNAEATLTIGNSRTLDAPFPGSLALWRMGATVPSSDQAQMIYRTELQLFQPGAKCLLDGTTSAVAALAYDPDTDELHVGTSWGRSTFHDLLRVDSAATTTGGATSFSASGGMLLSGNVGASVYVPAQNLRDELKRREEARKALGKEPVFFDFDTASFTATTTSGSNVLASVASVVGAPYIGMGITGTGIPAGATITGINGSTYYLSANATASGTAVAMGQSSFTLQQGYTAKAVYVAEALKREGPTRAYTRAFDGFRETVNFGVAPASAVWVSIMAVRSN